MEDEMLWGLILIIIAIISIHVPALWKKSMWRELAVFFFLLILGGIYGLGLLYHWTLPNPTKRMEILFEPLWTMFKGLLN